ncbi:hypothetical protein ACRALDRAFT_1068124 [Sodiomyces alcalophilus JCM 7366]|uniref:uncharacterized protein n=1 Tax=Sodiomyces alcalophilus JCM 7366 TaxID=591952 RepID=UPI0039B43716
MCVELSLHSACGHGSRRPMNCVKTWRYKTSCFYPLITAVLGDGPDKPCEKIRMRVCKPHPCPHCSAPLPGFETAPVVGGSWPARERSRRPEEDQRQELHRGQKQQRPISKALPPIPLQPVRKPEKAVEPTTMHADDVYQTFGILSAKAYVPETSRQKQVDQHPIRKSAGPQPRGKSDLDRQRTKDKVRRPLGTREGETRPSTSTRNRHPDGAPQKRHGRSNNPRNLRINTSVARPIVSGSRRVADPTRRPAWGRGEKPTNNGERTPATNRPTAKTGDGSRGQFPGKLSHLYRCDGGNTTGSRDSDESFACVDSKRVENEGWVEIDLGR